MAMESVPDTTNLVYLDEYPELAWRCWLRRIAAEKTCQMALFPANQDQLILLFPEKELPDGA